MATGDDKDTNLAQSGYPIKNVNMTVPLPGDTAAINNSTNGGGANLSPSAPQATDVSTPPAPTSTATANPIEGETENPYSPTKARVDAKGKAIAVALTDIQTIVKAVHAKNEGDANNSLGFKGKEKFERSIVSMTKKVLDNFEAIGREEAALVIEETGLDTKADVYNDFANNTDDTDGKFKQNIFGYNNTSSSEMNYLITDVSPGAKSYAGKSLEAIITVLSKELENKPGAIELLNKAVIRFDQEDKDGGVSLVEEAIELADFDIFKQANINGVSEILTNGEFGYSVADSMVEGLSGVDVGEFMEFQAAKRALDDLRESGEPITVWTGEHEAILNKFPFNQEQKERMKEGLMNPTTGAYMQGTSTPVFDAFLNVFRELLTPNSIATIAGIESIPFVTSTLLRSFNMGPEMSLFFGKQAKAATLLGLGGIGLYHSIPALYNDPYDGSAESKYNITTNILHSLFGMAMIKSGGGTIKGKTATIKGRNGKEYKVSTEANIYDMLYKASHPEFSLKNMNVVQGLLDGYAIEIQSGVLKSPKELAARVEKDIASGEVHVPESIRLNPRNFFEYVKNNNTATLGEIAVERVEKRLNMELAGDIESIKPFENNSLVKTVENKIRVIESKVENINKEIGLLENKEHPNWKDTIKAEDLIKKKKDLQAESKDLRKPLEAEIKINEEIMADNAKNAGSVIIKSSAETKFATWSEVIIDRKGIITKKVLPVDKITTEIDVNGEVTLNYQGKVGNKTVTAQDSFINSSSSTSTKTPLSKSEYAPYNQIRLESKLSVPIGTVENGWIYVGPKIGWRNLKQDNLSPDANIFDWHKAANDPKAGMYDAGQSLFSNGIVYAKNKLKLWGETYRGIATSKQVELGKFKKETPDGNVFSTKTNMDVARLTDFHITKHRNLGYDMDLGRYDLIKGNELWLKDLTKVAYNDYVNSPHDPFNPEVIQEYKIFNETNVKLYETLEKEGYVIEIWKEKGEPYLNELAMQKDIANKHLWVLDTQNNFGPGGAVGNKSVFEFIKEKLGEEEFLKQNVPLRMEVFDAFKEGEGFHPYIVEHFPMLGKAKGMKGMTLNDVYRAVHDVYAHSVYGNNFSLAGEYFAGASSINLYPRAARRISVAESINSSAFYAETGVFGIKTFIPKKTTDYLTTKLHNGKSVAKSPNQKILGNQQSVETFIKDSDPTNAGETGGQYRVIANNTKVETINAFLENLGDSNIKIGNRKISVHLKNIKKIKSDSNLTEAQQNAKIEKLNKELVDEVIIKASHEGREIVSAKSKGVFDGEAETGTFFTGEITLSESMNLSMAFGQESFLWQGGIINVSTGVMYPSTHVSTYKGTVGKGGSGTEVLLKDGAKFSFNHHINLSDSKVSDNLKFAASRYNADGNSSSNTSIFLNKKDLVDYNKQYNSYYNIETMNPMLDLNQKQNRYANILLEATKGSDSPAIVLDASMVYNPAEVPWIRSQLSKKKVNFVTYENGNSVYHKIEYKFDSKMDASSEAFFLNTNRVKTRKIEDIAETKKKKDFIANRSYDVKEVIDDPDAKDVQPNRNLKNHLANIDLTKFDKETSAALKGILDNIGDVAFKERVKSYYSFPDQLKIAQDPKSITAMLDMILNPKSKNSVFLDNGAPNPNLRINFSDVISSELLLTEALHSFTKAGSKNSANLVKQFAMAHSIIRESAGRTLGSTRLMVSEEAVDLSNLLGLDTEAVLLINKLFQNENLSPTMLQKIVEMRRNFLLASPGSIVRSTVGNVSSLILNIADQQVAGIFNEAISFFDYSVRGLKHPNYNPLQNAKISDALHFGEGFIRHIKDMPRLAFDVMKGDRTVSTLSKNEGFLSTPAWGTGRVGLLMTSPQRSQIALDLMIRKPAERGFIRQYAHKIASEEGLKGVSYRNRVAELNKKPTTEMMALAKQNAEFITFQNKLGSFGSMFNKIRTGKGSASQAMQFVVPFFNTAVNLTKRAYNMTPLGAFTPKYFNGLKTGYKTANWGDFSTANARMAVGTSLLYWANQSLTNGTLKVEGSFKDKTKTERELLSSLGRQPNSIYYESNGITKSFSFSGYEPIATILTIGKAYNEHQGEEELEQITSIFSTWMETFKQNPFMQGTEDLVDLMSGDVDLQDYMVKLSISTFVPNIINQAGKIKDPIKYENQFGRDAVEKLTNVQGWYDKFASEFRLVDNNSGVPKVNIFGNPVKTEDPAGALYAMRISDEGAKQTKSYTAIANEIIRLAPLLGDFEIDKNTFNVIDLAPKQKFMLEVSAGRAFYNFLENSLTGTYLKDENGHVIPDTENGGYKWEVGDELKESWVEQPDYAKVKTLKKVKAAFIEAQLFAIAPELYIQSKTGEWELADKKELVAIDPKTGDFMPRTEVIQVLTEKYRASTKGAKEINDVNILADRVITLMKRGMNEDDAINQILKTIK